VVLRGTNLVGTIAGKWVCSPGVDEHQANRLRSEFRGFCGGRKSYGKGYSQEVRYSTVLPKNLEDLVNFGVTGK
jgi:hypothetical protein